MIKWNSNCNRQRASCLWGEILKRLSGDFSSWVVDDFAQFSPYDMWLQIAREPEKELAFGEVGGIFRAQVLPAPLVRLIKSTSGQAHVVAQEMYNCEQKISIWGEFCDPVCDQMILWAVIWRHTCENFVTQTAIFHRKVENLCDALTLLQQFLERGSFSILWLSAIVFVREKVRNRSSLMVVTFWFVSCQTK